LQADDFFLRWAVWILATLGVALLALALLIWLRTLSLFWTNFNRSRLAMQKAAIVLDNDGFLFLDSRCELRTIRDCGQASADRLRKFVLIASRAEAVFPSRVLHQHGFQRPDQRALMRDAGTHPPPQSR
jgi:hypothetical protein